LRPAFGVVFVVGVIVGFGMGANPGKVAGLESRIQALTAENAPLKSRLAATPSPSAAAPVATPAGATAKP
jgi:hypothetical protein